LINQGSQGICFKSSWREGRRCGRVTGGDLSKLVKGVQDGVLEVSLDVTDNSKLRINKRENNGNVWTSKQSGRLGKCNLRLGILTDAGGAGA